MLAASWAVPARPPQKLGEQFEERWRRAYEVRHLENQNRHKAAATAAEGGKVRRWCGVARGTPAPACLAWLPICTQLQHPFTHTAAAFPHNSASAHWRCAAQAGGAEPVAVHASAHADAPNAPLPAAAPPAAAKAHALPSTGSPAAKPLVRQAEVEDDDEEGEVIAAETAAGGCGAAPAAAAGAGGAGAEQEGVDAEAGAEDEEKEPECRVVWDSSQRAPGAAPGAEAAGGGAAARLKAAGTECLRQGDLEGALRCYSEGLEAAAAAGEGDQVLAVLRSNRSHVLHKLRRNQEVGA